MRAFLAYILTCLIASPAFAAAVWPGNDGSIATFATRGLVVGQNWSTNDRDNYVTNSDCFVGTTGITASGTAATITRNTTTPLGETADCSLNLGTNAAGYVEWAVRTLPSGLAGQSCALYIAAQTFSVGTATAEWQVLQSSTVVARVSAVATTVPQPVVLNVPCGSSSALAATTIRLAHTAYTSGSTTAKVWGVQYKDARFFNLSSIAQSTYVGGARITYSAVDPTTSSTSYANLASGSGGSSTLEGLATSFDAASGAVTFSSLPAGEYFVAVNMAGYATGTSTTDACFFQVYEDTSGTPRGQSYVPVNVSGKGIPASNISAHYSFTGSAARTFRVRARTTSASNACKVTTDTASGNAPFQWAVYRFPSTGEQVVTPGSQNVYGARKWDGNQTSTTRNTNAYAAFSGATYASNVTNVGSATACTSSSDLCLKMPNLPAGDYSVSVTGTFEAGPQTSCAYGIGASNDSSNIITTVESTSSLASENSDVSSFSGVYTNAAAADREFYILGNRISGSNSCAAIGASSSRRITIEVKPLSRANIQPVLVQSPVRAAATGTAPGTGEVGEYRSQAGSTVSMTTATYSDGGNAGISLTAGCWDVNATCFVDPAGTTTVNGVQCGVGTASGNSSTGFIVHENYMNWNFGGGTPDASDFGILFQGPIWRTCVSSTTTYYPKSYASFGVAGMTTNNYIRARRVGDR